MKPHVVLLHPLDYFISPGLLLGSNLHSMTQRPKAVEQMELERQRIILRQEYRKTEEEMKSEWAQDGSMIEPHEPGLEHFVHGHPLQASRNCLRHSILGSCNLHSRTSTNSRDKVKELNRGSECSLHAVTHDCLTLKSSLYSHQAAGACPRR